MQRSAGIRQMEGVRLMTSLYVMSEVERNLPRIDQIERLGGLMVSVGVLPLSAGNDDKIELPEVLILPAKDRPVLLAAIRARADYLITGDKKHFSQWFGQTISGVRIESPTTLLTHFRLRKA